MVLFKALTYHLCGRTEGNQDYPQESRPAGQESTRELPEYEISDCVMSKTIDPASQMRLALDCPTPTHCVYGSKQQTLKFYRGWRDRSPCIPDISTRM